MSGFAAPLEATVAEQGVPAARAAYDMQKLKNFSAEGADEVTQERAAIVGALTLYLDFVNLFLLLLGLFGRR